MIYFDNASTTKPYKEVIEVTIDCMENLFANPASIHNFGFTAEKRINLAKENICNTLKIKKNELFFTSGGTEANNWSIFGVCENYKKFGKRIITTNIEHSSVANPFKKLEKSGFEVCYVDTCKKGYIDFKHLESLVNDETILFSTMFVNNEIGTILDLEKVYNIIKSKNKNTIIHIDGVQGFGKLKINFNYMDLLSTSAHKIHGPKGIGFLYIKDKTKLSPFILGGGQQMNMRSGTDNLPGIIGFEKAIELSYKNMEQNYKNAFEIKKEIYKICDLGDIFINGDFENGSPYILNLKFSKLKGEVLVHSLDSKDIFVSTGSACSTKNSKLKPHQSLSNIRFSFCGENNLSEAKVCVSELKKIIPIFKKYVRG